MNDLYAFEYNSKSFMNEIKKNEKHFDICWSKLKMKCCFVNFFNFNSTRIKWFRHNERALSLTFKKRRIVILSLIDEYSKKKFDFQTNNSNEFFYCRELSNFLQHKKNYASISIRFATSKNLTKMWKRFYISKLVEFSTWWFF